MKKVFNFGSPEDTALLYQERAAATRGPKLSARPPEEMSTEQLMNALIYSRTAYSLAEQDMQPKEVTDILMDRYDALFKRLADSTDFLQKAIKTRSHKFLGGYEKENIEKYIKLAGMDRSAS